jgi:hypothetical protein
VNIFVNHSGHLDWSYAIYALFEKRLGYKIYYPVGAGWKQHFIETPVFIKEIYGDHDLVDDILNVNIKHFDYKRRYITFQQFRDMSFNIMLVGNGRSELRFYNLAKRYQPKTIFIRQIANLMETPKYSKNVLLATKTSMPEDIKFYRYHMETHPNYKHRPYEGNKIIKSFSNYLRFTKKAAIIWDEAKARLPEFKFFMHGNKTDDKWIRPHLLPEAMSNSMFIWHTKMAGGGGFTCQEALASGKPLIVNKQYCKTHKTSAQDYLEDMVNCVDISNKSLDRVIEIIRDWAHPMHYEKKCKDVLRCYQKHFDFKKEAQQIRNWISTLSTVA